MIRIAVTIQVHRSSGSSAGHGPRIKCDGCVPRRRVTSLSASPATTRDNPRRLATRDINHPRRFVAPITVFLSFTLFPVYITLKILLQIALIFFSCMQAFIFVLCDLKYGIWARNCCWDQNGEQYLLPFLFGRY